MSNYTRKDEYGSKRGRYNLKGKDAIIGKNIYLRILLAINNKEINSLNKEGIAYAKEISKYINEKTGENKEASNLNKHLNLLEENGILEEVDHNDVSRGKKKRKFRINYYILTTLILDKVLFSKLNQMGLKRNFEDFTSNELILIFTLLFKRYISNFNEYLKERKFNDEIAKDISLKKHFTYLENLLMKINKKEISKVVNYSGLLNLEEQEFILKDFSEGFFKTLSSNKRILQQTIRKYYKHKKIKFDYDQSRRIVLIEELINIYFAKDRFEILSKINKDYMEDYLIDLFEDNINFGSL